MGGFLIRETLGSVTPRPSYHSGLFTACPVLPLLPSLDFSPWPLSVGPFVSLPIFGVYLFLRCVDVECLCFRALGCRWAVLGVLGIRRSVLLVPGSCPSDAWAGLSPAVMLPQRSHRTLPLGLQSVKSSAGHGATPLLWQMDCRVCEFPTGMGEMRPMSMGKHRFVEQRLWL